MNNSMSLCVTQLRSPLHDKSDPALNLRCESNQMIGLVGANGAGKSTFLKSIAGVLEPIAGNVQLQNYSLSKNPIDYKRHLGYCPDVFPSSDRYSVASFLKFVMTAKLHGQRSHNIESSLPELLKRYSLTKFAHTPISQLSLGERQRVNFAQATCNQPELLILDEPLNGLDPSQQDVFWDDMMQQRGVKIIASHHVNDLLDKCDRLLIMEDHKIVADISLINHQYLYVFAEQVVDENLSEELSTTNKKIIGLNQPPPAAFLSHLPLPLMHGLTKEVLHQLFKLVAQGKWQWR